MINRSLHATLVALFLASMLTALPATAQALDDLVDMRVVAEDLPSQQNGKRLSVGMTGAVPFASVDGIAVEIGFDSFIEEVLIRFDPQNQDSKWQSMIVVPSATGGTAIAGYREANPFSATRFEIRAFAPADGSLVLRDVGFSTQRHTQQSKLLQTSHRWSVPRRAQSSPLRSSHVPNGEPRPFEVLR